MINKSLLFLLLCSLVLYGLSLAFGMKLDCTIIVGLYTIKIPILLASSMLVSSILGLRIVSWLCHLPSRHIQRILNVRLINTEHKRTECLLMVLCEEYNSITNISDDNPISLLIRAMVAEKEGKNSLALRTYTDIAFNKKATKAERLLAAKYAIKQYNTWDGENRAYVEELIDIAESLGRDVWIMQSRFDLYIRNRDWHLALSMLECSIFCKNSLTPGDVTIKALLHCVIACEYESMNNAGEASKYWKKAIKTSNHINIQLMYYDFLTRIGTNASQLLEYLRDINHVHIWYVARLYLLLPNIDQELNIPEHPNAAIIKLFARHKKNENIDGELLQVLKKNDRLDMCLKPLAIMAVDAENRITSSVFFASASAARNPVVCKECMNVYESLSPMCKQCGKIGSLVIATKSDSTAISHHDA